MDAEELDFRCRTFDGWVHPVVVKLLIERGHVDEVRLQAEHGDWFCAHGLAKELDSQGERAAALDVLAPFADTGWTTAVETVAGFLSGWGRVAEAISLISPLADGGDRLAAKCLARLLAGEGRIDDVFALLRPRISDWVLAAALVSLTEGLGRDDEVLELLPPQGDGRLELRARVLERQGHVDEAILVLRARIDAAWALPGNYVDQLADIMVRHGRLAEVRDLAAGSGGEFAAHRLAAFLASRGEIDLAVHELTPFIEGGSVNAAAIAARLLAEHGRADEAIEILRPASARGGNPDWAVRELVELLTGEGRADEAIAFIQELAVQGGHLSDELPLVRAQVLAASGRREQAIAEIRAHPDAGEWWVADVLAGLLADNGQLDEAIGVLRQPGCDAGGNRTALAMLLVERGRVKEAITASQVRTKPWSPPAAC